ncbi:MAG: hypothetical protein JEY96_19180 [Bacteroidales bacterium]|nr:hypothetical protein [Bacteroidales bacterium]
MLFSEREQTEKIKVLEDGTTIINTYNNVNKHIKEEIILRNGRYKTTFFDIDEQPQYCSLYTCNGAFGLIYYEQLLTPAQELRFKLIYPEI